MTLKLTLKKTVISVSQKKLKSNVSKGGYHGKNYVM